MRTMYTDRHSGENRLKKGSTDRTHLTMTSRLPLSVLVMLLIAITLSEGLRGSGPKDCCYHFNENPILPKRVVRYVRTPQQCPVAAVRLKTVMGRHMCARSSASWVKDLINHIDAKVILGKTTNL
ncbi:C-C motif chemokine 2-like isoform X2 [Phycodurus eques]|nr:C-C motif chemokine 2-like isoform X2 [Phycodurus eques]